MVPKVAQKQRAALYFRQSLDAQEGIERQRVRCTALAEARGWVVVGEYEDNDTSATKARGAGTAWARLVEDAVAGRFDVVIAVDLDRLLRTIRDLVTLTDAGAKVLTVDGENDLTTADGEFRATMLAGIARFEARRKGERQKRAIEQAASSGRRVGGRRAFGFEQDGVTLREVEAKLIKSGYLDFLSGMPLAAIARKWNDTGSVSPQKRYASGHKGEDSQWHAYSVRMVLTNARYAGKRAHLGEVVADAVWPAVVDDSTWQAVNAALRHPSRRSSPRRGKYLLSGLAICALCGATVHAGGNSRKGVPAYRCSGALGHFARRSAPVDEFVEQVMIGRLAMPDATSLLATREPEDGKALQAEAVGIQERLDSLAIDFADGSLTPSQLRSATARLRSRLDEVESRVAESGRLDLLSPLVGAGDVGAIWSTLDISARRAVISVLASVSLHPVGRGTRGFDPATVSIQWIH